MHIKKHTCSECQQPCTPYQDFRNMENDEWIKYRRALYYSRSGNRRNEVLDRYKIAWTTLYNSPPLLDDGAPVNFLRNPEFTVSTHIPWFDQANFPPEKLHPRSSTIPPPQTGPSTIHHPQLEDPQPSTSDLLFSLSAPTFPRSSINDVLVSGKIKITLEGPFPRIIGGLNEGLTEYSKYQEKPRIRVIFILDPNFKVGKKGPDACLTYIVTHPN